MSFQKALSLLLLFGAFIWSHLAHAMDPAMVEVQKLVQAGKQVQAESIIARYLTTKENAAAYIDVGNVFARLKKWDRAVHYLELATKRDDHSALAWYELGIAQHQNKQVDDAVASLRKSIAISSKTPKSYFALGEILEFSHDYFDARNNYMSALSKLGDRADVRAKLCYLFYRDHFFRETIKQCSRAIQLNPRDVMSWTLLARAEYESEKKSAAFQTFNAILRKFPASAFTYRARGLLYLNEESYEQAAADLGKAFGLDPNDDESAIGLARSLYEMGRYDDALNIYVEACRMDRNYRFELLSKQRELGRKNKDEMAEKYQNAVDKL